MCVSRWISLGIICAIVLASASSWSEEKAVGPRCRIDVRELELQDRLWTQPFTQAFEFSNTGTEALRLSVEKTSCGCTAAMVSDSAVPPGATGSVRLTYTPDPKNKHLGMRSFTAFLSTNDPACAQVMLEMRVKLTDTVSPEPESLDFSGTSAALPVTITCYHWNGPRKVLSVEPSSPAIQVRALPAEEVEGELTRYKYEVTLAAAAPGKTVRANLVVRTDSPEVPVLEVPVRAEPPSMLSVSPEKLLFGVVRPGNAVTRTVTLTPNDAQSAPARAQSDDPRIATTLEPIPGAAKYKLAATLELPAPRDTTEKLKTSVEILDGAGKTVGNVGVFALLMPTGEEAAK